METAITDESIAQMRATNFEKLIINSFARETTQFFMFNCLDYEQMGNGKEIIEDKMKELEERFGRKFDKDKKHFYSNDVENFCNVKVDTFLGISVIGSNKNNRKKKGDS